MRASAAGTSSTTELISPLMKYFVRSGSSSSAMVALFCESSSRMSSAGMKPESAL